MKYEEEKKKAKEDEQKKRNMVRGTLDKQLKEQAKEKEDIIKYNQKMDQIMLKNARREIEKEKKQQKEHMMKVKLQKAQRDVMLLEA